MKGIKKPKFKFGKFFSLFLLPFSLLQLALMEFNYRVHLRIRYLHDLAYKNNKTYKKYSDSPISNVAHKTVVWGFIASFTFFTAAQYFIPGLFNFGSPNKVLAGNRVIEWTQKGHFTGELAPQGAALSSVLNQNITVSGTSPSDEAGAFGITGMEGMQATGYGTGADCDVTIASGVTINIKNLYELGSHSSLNGVTLSNCSKAGSNRGLAYGTGATVNYDPASGRVPNFNNLTINGTLTTNSLLALNFKVLGTLNINGTINASGLGYTGTKYTGNSPTGTNGGGKPGGMADFGYGGGGGGGYGNAGGKGDGGTYGGNGGNLYVNFPEFGSGGGGGGASYGIGTGGGYSGGNGGGIIQIGAGSINISSSANILANGTNGAGSLTGSFAGGGGGGAGGAVLIETSGEVNNVNRISAKGGIGGDSGNSCDYDAGGGGGGGAGGRVKVLASSTSPVVTSADITGGGTGGRITDCGSGYFYGATGGTGSFQTVVAGGSLTGFRVNAGQNQRNYWSSLSWNCENECSDNVKFQYRTSNEVNPTLESHWSSWSNFVTNSNQNIGIHSQWIELRVNLALVSGYSPKITSFSLDYDSLEPPKNENISLRKIEGSSPLKKSDGSEIQNGDIGGYTSESMVRVYASNLTCGEGTFENPTCGTNSTNLRPEVEVSTNSDFFGSVLATAVQGNNFAVITGLNPGSYHLRVRAIDDQGRVSAWRNYGEDNVNPDFIVEQAPPTGSFTFTGPKVSGTFATDRNVQLSINASDTGGSNLADMRFANEDMVWSDWESYATTKNWTLSNGDGNKKVFVQFRDNAGNVSGLNHTLTSDFSGDLGFGLTKENGEIKLFSNPDLITTINAPFNPNLSLANSGGDDDYQETGTYTVPDATSMRVTYNYSTVGDYTSLSVVVGGVHTSPPQWNSGVFTTEWIPGNTVKLSIYSEWGYEVYANVTKVEYRTSKLANSSPQNQYTSQVIASSENISFYDIFWSNTLDNLLVLEVRGSDNAQFTNGLNWSVTSKGQLFKNINGWNDFKYLQYRITFNTDINRSQTSVFYDLNINTISTSSITLDTQAPIRVSSVLVYADSAQLSAGNHVDLSNWYLNHQPIFKWAANSEADLAGYKYCVGASSCVPTETLSKETTTFTANFTTDGEKHFKIIALDLAGNQSVVSDTVIYKFDKSAPLPVSILSASVTFDTYIKVTWSEVSRGNGAPHTYTLERIPYYVYENGFSINDIEPEKVWSNAEGYRIFSGLNTLTVEDKVSDGLQEGVKYMYRIKTIDSLGRTGAYQDNGIVFGITLDGVRPEPPTSVVAVACSYSNPNNCSDPNNDNLKGKQIKVTWLKATDTGTGVEGYQIWRSEVNTLVQSDYVKVIDIDTPNPLPNGYSLHFYDYPVKDFTQYHYRIVAYDGAKDINGNLKPNFSRFSADDDLTNDRNYATVKTPDVTPPNKPVLTVTKGGLDSTNNSQKMNLKWEKPYDNNVEGSLVYKFYKANVSHDTNQSSSLTDSDFEEISNNTNFTCDLTKLTCKEEGLADSTYFYYRIRAIDPAGNISLFSNTGTDKTLSSAVPNPIKGRIINGVVEDYPYVNSIKDSQIAQGSEFSSSDVGNKAEIHFSGSKAKECTTNQICLVKYQVFRSTTNSDNEEDWVQIGPDIIPKRLDDDQGNQYKVIDVNLGNSTTYYYKIKAIGDNPSLPGGGETFSSINTGKPNDGWDTTPDKESPKVTNEYLDVKVKDTHPNLNLARNIVTWQMLSGSAVPKRNGISDFGKYEIWREAYNPSTGEFLELKKVGEILSIQDNLFTDEIKLNEDLIQGIHKVEECELKYFIQVVDNAGTHHKYHDGTLINGGYFNKSEKAYWKDSITPSKAKPELVDPVKILSRGISTAEIYWKTNQVTDGVVEFRKKYITVDGQIQENINGNYTVIGENTNPTQDNRTNEHRVRLFGLEANTEYDYRVVSKNYLGNTLTVSTGLEPLKTNDFSINYQSATPTTTTVEVRWTTSADANDNTIQFQKNPGQPGDPHSGTAGPEPVNMTGKTIDQLTPAERKKLKEHVAVIPGLRPNTSYTFNIVSVSLDGYVARRNLLTFTTKPFDTDQFTIAPSSSNIAERNITATTAQIVWQTAMPSTSWVDYSTKSGVYDMSAGNDNLTNQHVVVIEGLVPGTVYFYRVRSRDINNQTYTSQEYSFRAVLKPKIENLRVSDVTPYGFTLEWTTNVDTDTLINLGTSAAYGEKRGIPGLRKQHKVVVEGLNDNTEYHYQILAKDEMGNEVADTDKIVRTPLDTEGPLILNVKTDVLPIGADDSSASVIISWQTNKPATTMVEYDEGIIGGRYGNRSIEDKSLNLSHSVILKDLKPASSYHFKIVSKDKRGNLGQSPDHTFVTPTKEKSILQLILKSLEETFSWTKNIGQFFRNIGVRAKGK